MKGIAFSSIVIVALLGVLMLTVWSYSQLTSGAQYGGTIAGVSPKDISISKLETAKNFVKTDLVFASQATSLQVAAQGGTVAPITYWYCQGKPTPPELVDVQYALSNISNSFLNGYIKGLKDTELSKLGVSVSEYSCNGVYDSGKSNCISKDSSKCESFQMSASQGGVIQVTDPSYVTYSSDIVGDVVDNRFWWFYYKLYDDTKNNLPLNVIATGLRDQCRGPDTEETKIKVALDKLCDHYEQLFDQYVDCSIKVKCIDTANPIACLNIPCDVREDHTLCYKSQSTKGLTDSDFIKNLGGRIVRAQGGTGVIVEVTLTDHKFNIPSSEGLIPEKWILNMVMNVAHQDCGPIDQAKQ